MDIGTHKNLLGLHLGTWRNTMTGKCQEVFEANKYKCPTCGVEGNGKKLRRTPCSHRPKQATEKK